MTNFIRMLFLGKLKLVYILDIKIKILCKNADISFLNIHNKKLIEATVI